MTINCAFSDPVVFSDSDTEFQTMTCEGGQSIYSGFTSGEIVNSLFLFWIFVIVFFGAIILWLRGIKIKQ